MSGLMADSLLLQMISHILFVCVLQVCEPPRLDQRVAAAMCRRGPGSELSL